MLLATVSALRPTRTFLPTFSRLVATRSAVFLWESLFTKCVKNWHSALSLSVRPQYLLYK